MQAMSLLPSPIKSKESLSAALCRNLHFAPYLQLADRFQLMHSTVLSAGGIVGGADQGLGGIVDALAAPSVAVFKGGMPAAMEAVEMVTGA